MRAANERPPVIRLSPFQAWQNPSVTRCAGGSRRESPALGIRRARSGLPAGRPSDSGARSTPARRATPSPLGSPDVTSDSPRVVNISMNLTVMVPPVVVGNLPSRFVESTDDGDGWCQAVAPGRRVRSYSSLCGNPRAVKAASNCSSLGYPPQSSRFSTAR